MTNKNTNTKRSKRETEKVARVVKKALREAGLEDDPKGDIELSITGVPEICVPIDTKFKKS